MPAAQSTSKEQQPAVQIDTTAAAAELEQLLAKVAGGGVTPLLTKQVLDKILEAAAAAAAANAVQQQLSPQQAQPQQRPSLPDLSNAQETKETVVVNGAEDNDEDECEDSPAESNSPATEECLPRKSNLSGRSRNGGGDKLSVRFDPKQVNYCLHLLCQKRGPNDTSFNRYLCTKEPPAAVEHPMAKTVAVAR